MGLGGVVLGSLKLHLKIMRIITFHLSGFYYNYVLSLRVHVPKPLMHLYKNTF